MLFLMNRKNIYLPSKSFGIRISTSLTGRMSNDIKNIIFQTRIKLPKCFLLNNEQILTY